jgi:hypothetical protein
VVDIEQISHVERRGSNWPMERSFAPAQPPLTVTAHADAAS